MASARGILNIQSLNEPTSRSKGTVRGRRTPYSHMYTVGSSARALDSGSGRKQLNVKLKGGRRDLAARNEITMRRRRGGGGETPVQRGVGESIPE